MAVRDDYAGQGVGRQLMNAVLDLADNWLGLTRVELTGKGREVFGEPGAELLVKYHNGPIIMPAASDLIPDYEPLAVFRSELAENDAPAGVSPTGTTSMISPSLPAAPNASTVIAHTSAGTVNVWTSPVYANSADCSPWLSATPPPASAVPATSATAAAVRTTTLLMIAPSPGAPKSAGGRYHPCGAVGRFAYFIGTLLYRIWIGTRLTP